MTATHAFKPTPPPPYSAKTGGVEARLAIRGGKWTGHTSGLALDYAQGNVVILPESLASDLLLFCRRNPKPCPLLAVSKPGEPLLPTLGAGIDIRTDVPRYLVWEQGRLVAEVTEIGALWRADLVTFIVGCSFSFEHALMEAGIELRHVMQGKNVAMYKTNVETTKAGPFHGPMVVSMRPLSPVDAERAAKITANMPAVHGAPVHMGTPETLGIGNIGRPDFGDPIEIRTGEVPVFWACGVTLQEVALGASPDLCITHAPGCMLVTDLRNSDLRAF